MTLFESTAWTMVLSAGAGESQARDRFARVYAPVIRSYLAARWRLPTTHEAIDDGTQEVFVQCLKPGGALHGIDRDGVARFRSYLYSVVRNVADRVERRNGVRRTEHEHSGFLLDHIEHDEATLSRAFDRAWVVMIVRRAWLLMTARIDGTAAGRDRIHVLDLRYRDGEPSGRIATQLGCEPPRVYEQLRQAKHDFRSALLEVVGEMHPDADKAQLEALCIDLVSHL